MTRSAMEVVDGLARDGTSLAIGMAGGLFIAEQIGNAMLRNDERIEEEGWAKQPLTFGCYLSANGSSIRGEIKNLTVSFQRQGKPLRVMAQDILNISRSSDKPTCSISLVDGSSFNDVWLLSKIVIQTAAGDVEIDGSSASQWRALYGIRLKERRLIEAKREEERKADQKRYEAQEARKRRALREEAQLKRDLAVRDELRAAIQAKRLKQERRERLIPMMQGAVGFACLSLAGLLLAWMQLNP